MTDMQITARFAIVTLLCIAAVMGVGFVLRVGFDYDMGSGLGLVTIIVPAMEAGMTHARKAQQALTGGRMWKLAGVFGVVSLILSSGAALAVSALAGFGALSSILMALTPGELLLSTVIVMTLYILAARLFLGFGQRMEFQRTGE